MIKFSMDGFDDLSRELKRMQDDLKKLEGEHSVELAELLDDQFISRNTDFSSLDEMTAAYGSVETEEDLESEEWSRFVAEHSRFNSYREMEEAAATAWTEMKLKNLGL